MLKYCFIVNSVQVFFLLLPFHVHGVFFDMYFMIFQVDHFYFLIGMFSGTSEMMDTIRESKKMEKL